jgi:hypothetical protein
MLDYVVPQGQVMCSTHMEGLQTHASGIRSVPAQAGRSPRFCVHIIWWVRDATDSCSICSAVLCTEFWLLFPIRREEEKEKKRKMASLGSNQHLCWSHPVLRLPQLLCRIKNYFRGWSLNLMSTLGVDSNLVG